MKVITASMLAACLFASGSALAQSGESVVKSKGCLNCHSKSAPDFKVIAGKYKSDKGAQAKLASELKTGKGHPMPVQASDAELNAAVEYVLKQ
jgi:cytochrome c